MIRKHGLGHGILAAMLVLGAWRFTAAMTAVRNDGWATIILPVFLATVSIALIFYSWKTSASGHFAIACGVLGLSAATLWRLADPASNSWAYALSLVPAMLGAGILIEIRRGCGWNFSRRQGVSLILLGGLLYGAMTLTEFGYPELLRSPTQLNIIYPGMTNVSVAFQDVWSWFQSVAQSIVR